MTTGQKCEQDRLSFPRHNQATLRAELYQGIHDAMADDAARPDSIGKRIVLPSSRIGSPRYMNQLYQVRPTAGDLFPCCI